MKNEREMCVRSCRGPIPELSPVYVFLKKTYFRKVNRIPKMQENLFPLVPSAI